MRRGKKSVERVGQGTSWKNASERNGNVGDCAYPLYARDCPGRPNTRERAPSNTEGRCYPKRATPNACTCGCVGERGGGVGGLGAMSSLTVLASPLTWTLVNAYFTRVPSKRFGLPLGRQSHPFGFLQPSTS
ncbi:hypothetical protein, unlikely [Trypanosoma brucei brucei TREU927]|uniref:Uncharacterized protein n=1 Tax=Trypanosoma brucei brucei (strain 927/4 GUTat10.1) TaxID=185431 RepID=Q38FG3_TRYB2|nr:hypothetical protein, unlikely [Trypanosoma brucei brucei TREU927]EAN76457.1 hypothetical protein, unlikely [Trypanosoma brucei brucei TREU927]